MSHFYGTLKGSRGGTTRCGSKDKGIQAIAASWEGAVCVDAWYEASTDIDMVRVCFIPWHGRGEYRELYIGPINGKAPEQPGLFKED